LAKILDTEGHNRIRAASADRQTAARAVDDARELWRSALIEEERADAEFGR
jgi:hypothetical protein